MMRAAESVGIAVLPAQAEALNDRLAETAAEFLFVVRWGIVVGDLLPKAVGFLDRFPATDLTYGDSVTAEGMPLLRPLFSPIRLRSNDYLGPVLVVRTGVVRTLGGFRPEARRAQVLDLALRAHAAGRTVALDPQVLATEDLAPGDFAGTSDAQTAVVASHLEELGIAASVEVVEPFVRRVRYEIVDEPLVSVSSPPVAVAPPSRAPTRARRRGHPGDRGAVDLPEPGVRRGRRRGDARRCRDGARGALRRPPSPGALGCPVQLQREDEPGCSRRPG